MSDNGAMHVSPVAIGDIPPTLRALAQPRPGMSEEAAAQHEAWVGLFAHSPEQAARLLPYYFGIWHNNSLGPRLTELVRLAIANTTRCEVCLAARVPAAVEAGLSEDEISYITELDQGNFSPRERAAIRFALNFGGDHHSIDAAQWAELADVFTSPEIVELCLLCSTFLGLGRLAKAVGLVNATCTLPGSRLRALADTPV